VRASDIMTPAIFAVAPETPAAEVAGQMVDLNVHRLFVVDHDNVLIGVISALDLLRYFRP
jgi:CBS domain-containing protein